jgi:hypothetical protein
MNRLKFLLLPGLALWLIACKDPYRPDLISSSKSYLVVEGILNAGAGPTTIHLSRSFKLDDSATLRGESNATVMVEGKDNIVRHLIMTGDGSYTSDNLGLAINGEYRLRINTTDGKEYLSDYVVARQTPPIDSLSFEQNDKGVEVQVSTHDPANNTRYYLWNFDETWEIWSFFYSFYKFENDQVVLRGPGDEVSTCWKYDFSNSILIGSSASLQSDAIYRAPLIFLPNGDEKLTVRYSILARQYALDKRAYEFYDMMRKNTESLGSIFDAQPSEIRGNIHNTADPGELVIGYVSACDVAEKRFFISKTQIRDWYYYQQCDETKISNNIDSVRYAYTIGYSIYDAVFMGPFIVGYKVALEPCVDCRRRGGSLARPSYW